MNPIDKQRAIIDQLFEIVRGSCPAGASSASCRFEYLAEADGSSSVTQTFGYVQQGKSVSAFLDRALRAPVSSLVRDLHAAMKAHTGGDWRAFILAIDPDGRVTVRFEYPDEASRATQPPAGGAPRDPASAQSGIGTAPTRPAEGKPS